MLVLEVRIVRVLGLLALLVGLCCCGCNASKPERPKVLFVGVDGANWVVIGRLLAQGELPTFERLTQEGAYMPRFETMDVTDSPIVWTTVATGRLPRDHGVTSYVERLPNGKTVPISSNSRKVKAIWEIAGENGLSVGVLGWWASWPAERVNGYVVTDHANPIHRAQWQRHGYWSADAAQLEKLARDFYPVDLGPVLEGHWLDTQSFSYERLQRRSKLTSIQMELLKAAPWNARTRYSLFKTYYAIDYPLVAAAEQLAIERPTDLQMLYLRGPDPIQHYAWDTVEPERYPNAVPNLDRDRGIVDGVYRYVETFLEELLAKKAPNTWLIVASDHGAEPTHVAGPVPERLRGRPGGHSTNAKGVLFILGPHVKAGHRLQTGDPRDLMPTMAWLLGLPLSEQLTGEVLTDAFEETFVIEHPVETIPSYGSRQSSRGMESPEDEAMMERLRALGYVR